MRADHLVPLLLQEAGGDRGIDPARHRDQHRRAHATEATARPGRSRTSRVSLRAMIEARFDDLTGASPSFRLVEPVGVLEATRPDEVRGVLEAAEGAAARGLWVAGYVAYEAAPGLDPALAVRDRAAGDPFERLPSRGSRCSSDARTRPSRSPQADPDPSVAAAWRPSIDRDDLRPGDRPHPRRDRRGRDLPGELHAPPAVPGGGRRARPLPRPLLRAAGRVRRVPEPRALPGALGLPRAVLPARRRRAHDEADEGHRPARTMARGGRRPWPSASAAR